MVVIGQEPKEEMARRASREEHSKESGSRPALAPNAPGSLEAFTDDFRR